MKRLFLLLSLFLFLLLAPRHIFAQTSDYTVEKFDSGVVIRSDGTVHVTEHISAQFNVAKHGIYRYIPYKYKNSDGSAYYTEIKNVQIPGHEYSDSREDNNLVLKIGDPDVTVTGSQQYEISYDVVGVLRGFSDHDELYWNVTGNGWDTSIASATATVRIEKGAFSDAKCFEGASGSKEPCAVQTAENELTIHSNRQLEAYEGMTFVAGYPKGVIPLITVKSFAQRLFSPMAGAVFFITFGLGIAGILLLWSLKGRDLWQRGLHLFNPSGKEQPMPLGEHEQVVVEYEPPEKLRPAEIGVLVDERADTLDVTATIIDLATRGYLTIEEQKKKWVFGSTDYIFTRKNKLDKGLEKYEKELLDRLFDEGDTVSVSSLKKSFYSDLKKVKDMLYEDMVTKGYFPGNPESTRSVYLGLGILVAVAAGVVLFMGIERQNEYLTMFCAAGVLTGLNLLFFSRFMSRRTAKGHEAYRRIRGYRLFISDVEKYRQQFFERKNMFNTVLPYAIVFGLTGKFAQAMKDMGVTPEQAATAAWYHGTGAFNLMSFENSMSSFSSSLGTAMASTPSSSGGFSGGGSGGGFGGGGGGSW